MVAVALRKLFSGKSAEAGELDLHPDDAVAQDGPARVRRSWRRWLLRGLFAMLVVFVLLVGWLGMTAPLSRSLKPIAPPQITLLASDGTPIARKGAIVEAPVQVAKLPDHVIQAFLAIEDRRFYEHWGIDPRGIARAVWSNLTTGRTQGGSTITQQLAKFTFLTPERTLTRKAREMLIAFWLEAWLSKDEILERYLSNAYFGGNTYGLRAASLHYFYRQPERLTPGQAAMLAGLLQAPSRLAPTNNFDLAEKRMRLVLQSMVAAGYLSQQEAAAIPTPVLDVRARNELPTGTYFADWALPEARNLSDVGYARQTITTTLDSRLQAAARRAVARSALGSAQVALVAMRPDGEVVAMVGGRDYAASPFNRATQARRQPGSTFKLFVYLAALREGWQPDDVIENGPIESGSYRPQNVGDAYSKTITLENAFAQSSNVAAVRLLGRIGHKPMIATARDLGVSAPLPEGDPSLALGTASMTLLELTAAYSGVASNRYPVLPRAFPAKPGGLLDWVFDDRRSLPREVHTDIERLLRAAISKGTGRAAMLSQPVFGKTGTSQDSRDALFVGYAGGLVTGVWVGNDDNSPLAGISGGGVPAQIWRDFMDQALGPAPRPQRRHDPDGPVQPQDVIDLGNIPLGKNTHVRIEKDGTVISTEIEGLPFEVRINEQGMWIDGERMAEQIAREARKRHEEEMRRRAEQARGN